MLCSPSFSAASPLLLRRKSLKNRCHDFDTAPHTAEKTMAINMIAMPQA